MGSRKGELVDHINHNTLDNRKGNLRNCTHSENHGNEYAAPGKTSKYKGVSKHTQTGRFRACIKHQRKYIHLGYFKKEKEAARAYDKAAKEHFGGFAYLNFKE